jgi:hypothetical protein
MSLNVNNLPFEILEKIFEELGKKNMIDLMSNIPIVCKTWNIIFNKGIFKEIKYLKFDYFQSLTDKKVKSIVNKCSGITHANFGECEDLTDAAVLALADKCSGIKRHDFWGSFMITDRALKIIDIVIQKN